MALRFIFGRGGAGKSSYILDEIKRQVKSDEKTPVLLIVPDQYTFEIEKKVSELYLREEKDKYLRTRVLSFNSLSRIVFSQVGGLTDVNINTSGKAMITYKAVESVANELKVFSKSMTQPGFISSISDTISELKQYNLSYEKLDEVSDRIENEMLSMKLKDISKIYESFEKNLHEKYVDSQDMLESLANKISMSNYLDGARVYIDEFTGFTPKQYNTLKEILKNAKEVNISLTLDRVDDFGYSKMDIFSRTKFTYNKFIKMCKEESIEVLKPINLNIGDIKRFDGNKELLHLEKYYNFYPYKIYNNKTNNIEIKEFNNLYHEIEEIAKEITILVREKGIRYKDITIATRDLNRYNFLVQSIFSEYDIPYFIDEKRESKSNPIIVLIISILEMKNKGYKYDTMFRYLKSGLLGFDDDDISLLENYVLANGIKGNKWFEEKWNYRVNHNYSNYESEYELNLKNRINEIRNEVLRPILEFQGKLKRKNKVEEICKYIYEFLLDIKLPETIESLISEFKTAGDLDRASQYSQIWDIVIDMFDQMVELLGDEFISIDRFTKLLNLGFEENELGLVPPSLDQVLVSSVDRMKNTDTKYLYLVGAIDGVFPMITKDDGLINDKDRYLLEEKGIEVDIDSKTKTYEEQFLVYRALTSTKENLIVSYPISDHEGKTLRPSTIVSRLKKIFPNVKDTSYLVELSEKKDDTILKKITAKKPTFNEMINAFKEYDVDESHEEVLNSIWLDVYRFFLKDDQYKTITDNLLKGLRYTNRLSKIEDKKVKQLYQSNLLSVSRLEKYSECPFSYFIQYGLKAKERKEYNFTPPDLGIFVHNILEIFSKELSKDRLGWRDIDNNYIKEKVSVIVDELIKVIPGYILNSSARYKYLSFRLKKMLTSSVTIISHHIKNGAFEPAEYEVQFGIDSKYPPIKIVLQNGEEINLIGQIDRIDEFEKGEEKYIRIIDYKSGTKSMSLTDVYHGLQLQLMVYLDAMLESKNTEGVDLKPAAIMYFKIDDPIASFNENKDDGEIKEAILKELRMKGLLLKDSDIIREMDKNLQGEGRKTSLIIPVSFNKDGTLGKGTSLVDYDEFDIIRKYVKQTIVDICEDMMGGNIDISPYKHNNSTSCDFCKYSAICQFDTTLKDNKYMIINKKSNDEIIQMMKGDIVK